VTLSYVHRIHAIVLRVQVLGDRIDNMTKQIQDLEGKSQSLQLTVDRLSLNLAKTEEEESSHKVRSTFTVTMTTDILRVGT